MIPTTHHGRLVAALLLLVPVACGDIAANAVDQGVDPPPSSATAGAAGRSPGTPPPHVGEGGHASAEGARGGSNPHVAGHSSGSSGAGGQKAAAAGASGGDTANAGGTAGIDGDAGGSASGSAGNADQSGGAAGAPTVEGGAGQAGEGGGAAGGGGHPIDIGGGAAGSGAAAVGSGTFICNDLHGPDLVTLDAYVRVAGKAPVVLGSPATRIVARWRALSSKDHPYTYTVVYAYGVVDAEGTFDLGTATEASPYELTLFAEPAAGTPWDFDLYVDRATPPLSVVAGKQGDVTHVSPEAFTVETATLSCAGGGRPPGVRIPGKK